LHAGAARPGASLRRPAAPAARGDRLRPRRRPAPRRPQEGQGGKGVSERLTEAGEETLRRVLLALPHRRAWFERNRGSGTVAVDLAVEHGNVKPAVRLTVEETIR